MRELLILRHAKSSWDAIDGNDHDRDLAPRGIAAARAMGSLLRERGWLPDRILCSSAVRAQHTLALACESWPAEPPLASVTLATLYLATPSRLMEIVRRQPDSDRRLLVVGHNPGLAGFAARLIGYGDANSRESLAAKFPTAALARLTFDIDSWRALAWTTGTLQDYRTPRGN